MRILVVVLLVGRVTVNYPPVNAVLLVQDAMIGFFVSTSNESITFGKTFAC